jgi:hypothetical protein
VTGFGKGFAPSAGAANAALGGTVRQEVHPPGLEGTKFSLAKMGELVRDGRNDPRVRGWAGRVLMAAGKPKSATAQTQAILDEIRRKTIYVQDPVNTELMAKPHITLCLDEHGLCMPAADCDDRVVALASGTMSIGIETMVVGQAYGTEQATHVICAILDPDTGWQRVDPSAENYAVGKSYPATKEWWLDPISGSVANSAQGTVTTMGKEPEHGDYIGVGAIPFEHAYGAVDEGCQQSPAYVTPDLMHGACPMTQKIGPCPNPAGCCGTQTAPLGSGVGLGQVPTDSTSSLPLGLAMAGMAVGAAMLFFVAWEIAQEKDA